MRRISGLFLAGLLSSAFLFSASVAWGQQVSSVPPVPDLDHAPAQDNSQSEAQNDPAECSRLLDAARTANEAVERDRQQLEAATNPGVGSATLSAGPFPSDLRQDLMVLQQRKEALNRCASPSRTPVDVLIPEAACSGERIVEFQMAREGEPAREVPIQYLPGASAFFYEAGMTIDADGAPNAYHPDNTGLDDLTNAGGPGNWEGLAKNRYGDPFVQGADDPFPGYYVSATALADRTRPVNDPLRYVDASKIPYIVLPGRMARQLGARPGDFAVVVNQRNASISYAIFGDIGPSDRIGEGSVALAENLGIRSNARNGGTRGGILYLVFPGSGDGGPHTIEEINAEAEKLFQAWGGLAQLSACKIHLPERPFEGNRNTN